MFDFPASPANGQTYAPPGGPVYQWSAATSAWLAFGAGGGGASIYVDVAPPAVPKSNQLWWESDSGNLYLWFDDGNSQQWVQISGQQLLQPGTWPTADTRNRIVNGAMQISQENGNTAGAGLTYFPADQWATGGNVGTFAFSAQRVQVVTPKGSANRLRMTVTTAQASLAAANAFNLQHKEEGLKVEDFGWGTASARQVVLRFGWKSPAGTWSVSLRQSVNRSYVANFTISAAQANIDTEQVIVIPGDTAGTWPVDNSEGLLLTFAFAVGSTFQGSTGWQAGSFTGTSSTTNGVATNGNVFEIFDVGLYLDPQNTGLPPPWQEPDFAQELLACKRYWETQSGVATIWTGAVTSGISYTAAGRWEVAKRVQPTLIGVSSYASAFPSAIGTLTASGALLFYEGRAANATGSYGQFNSTVTGSARM